MVEQATVLLTGFEPFDGADTNPSRDAVHRVAEGWMLSARLVTAELAVAYQRCGEQLEALLSEHDPDVVICTGLAAGRKRLSLERLAVNRRDARIADNDGEQPGDAPVLDGAQTALWSSLPVKRALRDLQEAGIPGELSMTAGTFVCNAAFYRVAAWAYENPTQRRAGFVHVPAEADMDLATMATGLRIIAEAGLDPAPDLSTPAGAES